ncbi:MAG: hypothetical protein RSC56_01630 [Acidaminococcaceae bacterium]
MSDKYVTVVGSKYYYGLEPFALGRLLVCVKEHDNAIDTEAISVKLPFINKIGYLGNAPYTVASGTYSAGRLYDHVGEAFYIRVCFIIANAIICRLEQGDKTVLRAEYEQQAVEAVQSQPVNASLEQWD